MLKAKAIAIESLLKNRVPFWTSYCNDDIIIYTDGELKRCCVKEAYATDRGCTLKNDTHHQADITLVVSISSEDVWLLPVQDFISHKYIRLGALKECFRLGGSQESRITTKSESLRDAARKVGKMVKEIKNGIDT